VARAVTKFHSSLWVSFWKPSWIVFIPSQVPMLFPRPLPWHFPTPCPTRRSWQKINSITLQRRRGNSCGPSPQARIESQVWIWKFLFKISKFKFPIDLFTKRHRWLENLFFRPPWGLAIHWEIPKQNHRWEINQIFLYTCHVNVHCQNQIHRYLAFVFHSIFKKK